MLSADPELPANPLVETVKSLFAETNALAQQLRKETDHSDPVRLGGRGILKVLGNDGPLTVPEIARVRGTSRQNIQTLVNRLEGEGCVDLAGNPAHRKSALVRITDRGRTLLESIKQEEAKSLELLLPHLSEAELASAVTSLRRVRHALAGLEAPKPARKARPLPEQKPRRTANHEPPSVSDSPSAPVPALAANPSPPANDPPDEGFPVNLL